MIRILVGGDFLPILRSEPFAKAGDVKALFPDHLALFQSADLFVLNLECPLCSFDQPAKKGISHAFRAHPECVKVLNAMGITTVNLSNNHIMDYQEDGFRETIHHLDDAGIEHFGAGMNLKEAEIPWKRELRGCKVGMVGISSHEFNIASSDTAGAYPIDVYTIGQKLEALRVEVDFLLVLVHAGNYNYRYPSPRLQKLCRMLVDFGAGAVICQHSHIAGTIEEYNNALIVYGQGNFLFDHKHRSKEWNEAFLVELHIGKDAGKRYLLHPFEQSGNEPGVRKLSAEGEENFWLTITDRNKRLIEPGGVERLWQDWCRQSEGDYYYKFISESRIFRRLDRLFGIAKRIISGRRRWLLLNTVRCEQHNELVETMLDNDD